MEQVEELLKTTPLSYLQKRLDELGDSDKDVEQKGIQADPQKTGTSVPA